jgi:glycosyltransferase involved in cell wall biosynthesis
MTTLITHIFNEEFLLPYWIEHHLQNFEDGIVIDFNSTDSSLEIIKDLAPHWKIIDSPLRYFEAEPLDRLIEEIENSISGIRICLNVTEFLIGDASSIVSQNVIPQVSLINMPNDLKFVPGIPFHEQRNFGLISNRRADLEKNKFPIFSSATGRSIHRESIRYPLGRHFELLEPNEMLIYRVSDCFVNEKMFERRLQIQSKIPKSEYKKNRGNHHTNSGKGLDLQNLLDLEIVAREFAINLKPLLDQAYFFQDYHQKIRNFVLLSPMEHQFAWKAAKANFEIVSIPNFDFRSKSSHNLITEIRENYEKSISWKVSKPIRVLGNLFRRIFL